MSTPSADHLIDSLKWRYATKKFDASKKVSESDLETLKEIANLTATSYGLQPFRVLIVENTELREKLKPAAYGQTQITDASHLAVFCTMTSMTDEYVDDYMNRMADTRGIDVSNLKGFADAIKGQTANNSEEGIINWNKRQTYIALGHWLVGAAELRIDACPMEGFDPAQFDEILGLKEHGLTATVLAPIGYRSEEDGLANAAKIRLPLDDLFMTM